MQITPFPLHTSLSRLYPCCEREGRLPTANTLPKNDREKAFRLFDRRSVHKLTAFISQVRLRRRMAAEHGFLLAEDDEDKNCSAGVRWIYEVFGECVENAEQMVRSVSITECITSNICRPASSLVSSR